MNTSFKFRAWDTKNKKFLDFIPPKEYMLDGSGWEPPNDLDTFTYPDSVFARTFNGRIIYQQCTGLKDKKWNLIYEGDIVLVPKSEYSELKNCLLVVEYCCPAWVYRDVSTNRKDSITSIIGFSDVDNDAEVVGNIFENKELLSDNL